MRIGEQRPAAAAALERLIRGEPWMFSVVVAARACGAPDCWVGGGVLRDLVWDQLHGGFDPARVKDVDAAFYDPDDLTPQADQAVEAALRRLAPAGRVGRQEPSLGAPVVRAAVRLPGGAAAVSR